MSIAAYQLSFNGITVGDGTNYDITQLDGLDAQPAPNQNDLALQRDWGSFIGSYYADHREVQVLMEITNPAGDTTDATFRGLVEAWAAAFQTLSATELPCSFLLPGMPQAARRFYARVADRQMAVDYAYTRHFASCAVKLWATDPRIYDDTQQTATLSLPTGTGGATWPVTWPLSWGSSSSGGTATLANAGNFESRPVCVITGPIDNPTLQNNTTGLQVTFGLSLGATDTLTIDFHAKTVLLNGSGNRRGTMTANSQWWTLIPGNNAVQFTANTTHTGSTATFTWRSAWL